MSPKEIVTRRHRAMQATDPINDTGVATSNSMPKKKIAEG